MIIIIFKNLYIVTEIKQIINYAYIVERWILVIFEVVIACGLIFL